jgi:hypothetical protein
MKFQSIAIGLLLALAGLNAIAQEPRCGPHELSTSLPLANPAYSDAMILRQDLTEDGLGVECVLQSKWRRMFFTSKGNQNAAALFRTDHGDFEVLLLPKPFVFDFLTVNEQKNDGSYSYSFSGDPYSELHIESIHRMYFVKRGNKMFETDNAALAATLTDAPMR